MAARTGARRNENQTEEVNAFMAALEHPLKAEIEAVREIIKANDKIAERVKWNAPSFFYKEDLVTFNPRAKNHVHLVFHNPAIIYISSPLLEGNYKDRRMTYFYSMEDVENKRQEMENIMQELVDFMHIKYN